MRFGGESAKLRLRLFNRRAGNFSLDLVHERPVVAGKVGQLRAPAMHYSYQNLDQYFEKFNRYTSAGARQAFERRRRVSRWSILTRLPLSFCYRYFLRGLILDGYPGFVWALLSAFSPTVKYIKLRELCDQQQPNGSPKR